MARFEAFRGTAYVPGKVVADDVIAPPYDVVNAAERSRLASRSPYNAIHVELPRAEGGADPYEHAAALFSAWHEEGAVAVASDPTFYVYRMTFGDEGGSRRSTTGVLGALGLDPAQTGAVLPHEQTTPKDKHDRLSLLRAAKTNFSPIWGLSLASGLAEACMAAIETAESAEPWRATDDEGTVHETWAVSDPDAVRRITDVVAGGPVLIADGHHRYETACTYFIETGGAPGAAGTAGAPGAAGTAGAPGAAGAVGADAALAFVVELVEEQLSVRAIHRLLTGVDAAALPEQLGAHFEVRRVETAPQDLLGLMTEEGGLGLLTREGAWLLVPSAALLDAAEDDLDSSRLAFALSDLGIAAVRYQHGVAYAEAAVASGDADAAVLLRPVTIAQIARTAHGGQGGRRMPPKSTFFHPKLRTGMVFRELDPD